jgi:ribosome-associated heat shock protein Hsp15
MRLDKWLWCARLYKTRPDAAEALRSGKVQVAGLRVKASKLVTVGMVLQVRSEAITREITVLALSSRRLSAAGSMTLYQEGAASIARRDALVAQMKLDREMNPRPRGRPTKRQRRKIIQFRRGPEETGRTPDEDDHGLE